MTIIGIYGLQDPLRPEIKDSVQKCYKAGITIRMVTGDNLDTANAANAAYAYACATCANANADTNLKTRIINYGMVLLELLEVK